jgi:hypothetical protein
MASDTESDAGYRRVTPVAWVLAPYSMGTWMRRWFHVWRWPAGLVAGLVLWLALVAVVGAATSVSSPASRAPVVHGLAGSMDRTIMRMS